MQTFTSLMITLRLCSGLFQDSKRPVTELLQKEQRIGEMVIRSWVLFYYIKTDGNSTFMVMISFRARNLSQAVKSQQRWSLLVCGWMLFVTQDSPCGIATGQRYTIMYNIHRQVYTNRESFPNVPRRVTQHVLISFLPTVVYSSATFPSSKLRCLLTENGYLVIGIEKW